MGNRIADPERRAPIKFRQGAEDYQSRPGSRVLRQTGMGSVVDKRLVEEKRSAGCIRAFADTLDFIRLQNGSRGVMRVVQESHGVKLRLKSFTKTVHRRSKELGTFQRKWHELNPLLFTHSPVLAERGHRDQCAKRSQAVKNGGQKRLRARP